LCVGGVGNWQQLASAKWCWWRWWLLLLLLVAAGCICRMSYWALVVCCLLQELPLPLPLLLLQ
jgi:hypothetical protein